MLGLVEVREMQGKTRRGRSVEAGREKTSVRNVREVTTDKKTKKITVTQEKLHRSEHVQHIAPQQLATN